MYLDFDVRNMNLRVLVGVEENYAPNEEVRNINKKVKELHAELTKFQNDVVAPKIQEIQALVKEENDKFLPKNEEESVEGQTE